MADDTHATRPEKPSPKTEAPPGEPDGAPVPRPSRSDPLAGSAFRALRKLGEGGAGEVFLAEHIALGKRVAVKLLKRAFCDDPVYLDRMRVEAQALARLRSPHLIEVSDFGRTPEGRPFFVMEYVEGRSLLDEVRLRGCIPVAEAVHLVIDLLEGLAAAHALGIIHRDIKLENLLLSDPAGGRRTLKILDFGIAKILPGAADERAPAPALPTQEGAMLGTPRFLSPEQVLCGDVDARTDVYGAGMVLYELLAGRDPFYHVRDHFELLEAHLSAVPPPPSALAPQPIDSAIDAVVLCALEKRPEDRHATAAEFSAALARALEKASRIAAVEPPPSSRHAPNSPPAAVPSLAIAVLIVLGSAVLSAVLAVLLNRVL